MVARMEGDEIVVESAMGQFKIRGKFVPSWGKKVGFAKTTPYAHFWYTNSGVYGVMAFGKKVDKESYGKAIGMVKKITKEFKKNKRLRYDLIDEVLARMKMLLKRSKRIAVGTAPLFLTYPIPGIVVYLTTLKMEDTEGIVACENLRSRFGVKAFVTWPVKGIRSTGYVKVVGRPKKVEEVLARLVVEARNAKVFE